MLHPVTPHMLPTAPTTPACRSEDELLEWFLTSTTKCPLDNTPLDPSRITKPSRIVMNMLGELRRKCSHHARGCAWTGELERAEAHERVRACVRTCVCTCVFVHVCMRVRAHAWIEPCLGMASVRACTAMCVCADVQVHAPGDPSSGHCSTRQGPSEAAVRTGSERSPHAGMCVCEYARDGVRASATVATLSHQRRCRVGRSCCHVQACASA
jgi:hypothetical protein